MKNILYTFLFTFISSSIYTQPSITWQKIYLNNYQQYTDLKGTDVCPADSGNFYVAANGNLPHGNFNILKLNAYGDTIWTREIDSLSNNICGCCSSGDGGVVCSGEGAFSVKYDKDGNLIWEKKYGFATTGYKIIRTFDGNFLICGSVYTDFVRIFKIDANGNLIWMKQDTNMYYGNYNSVIETNDHNYLCVGYKDDINLNDSSSIILFDTSGNILWKKTYNSINIGSFNSIDKINNGYIIYGTGFDSLNRISSKFFKIDEFGKIKFFKQFNGETEWQFQGMDVKKINENKYLLCSAGGRNNPWRQESKLYITDSLGNILIEKIFGDSTIDIDYLKRAYIIGNGDIILEGEYSSHNDIYIYSYTVRIDSNLYVPPIAIKRISENIIVKYNLFQNYPNPFNPTTKIKFEIPQTYPSFNKGGQGGLTNLVVYDILGREVAVLVNEKLQSGIYEVIWDATKYASGIYFYSLIIDNKIIDTKKMVVLK